jgi:hypothetical protein
VDGPLRGRGADPSVRIRGLRSVVFKLCYTEKLTGKLIENLLSLQQNFRNPGLERRLALEVEWYSGI